jgi:hypothetical protein
MRYKYRIIRDIFSMLNFFFSSKVTKQNFLHKLTQAKIFDQKDSKKAEI